MRRLLLALSLLPLAARSLPAQGGAWRIDPTPLLDRTGTGRPGEEFAKITSVVRFANGALAVAQETAPHLLFLDATGARLAATGRQGGGPGEFSALSWAQLGPGDSLHTWDWQQKRFSVFARDGRFIRSAPFPATGLPPNSAPIGALSGGRFLSATVHGTRFPFPGREWELGAEQTSLHVTGGAKGGWHSAPFPSRTTFGLAYAVGATRHLGGADAPFGAIYDWTTLGDAVVTGSGSDPFLTVADADGAVRKLTLPRSRAPLTAADRARPAAALRRCLADAPDPAIVQIDSLLLAGLAAGKVPFPGTLPAHGRLLSDPAGMVWVQAPSPVGLERACGTLLPGAAEWSVLDRNGSVVATVSAPAGLRVQQVTADAVVGVWLDADGAEHVRVHRLARSGR